MTSCASLDLPVPELLSSRNRMSTHIRITFLSTHFQEVLNDALPHSSTPSIHSVGRSRGIGTRYLGMFRHTEFTDLIGGRT